MLHATEQHWICIEDLAEITDLIDIEGSCQMLGHFHKETHFPSLKG